MAVDQLQGMLTNFRDEMKTCLVQTLRQELAELQLGAFADLNEELHTQPRSETRRPSDCVVPPPVSVSPRPPREPEDEGALPGQCDDTSDAQGMPSMASRRVSQVWAKKGATDPSAVEELRLGLHRVAHDPSLAPAPAASAGTHLTEVWAKRGAKGHEAVEELQKQEAAQHPIAGRRASTAVPKGRTSAWQDQSSENLEINIEHQTSCSQRLSDFVQGVQFDCISGFLVVVNAALMGIQIDWQARRLSTESPVIFRIFEVFFCVIFTFELVLRIIVYKKSFFSGPNMKWHLFDTFLVGTQLLEEIMGAILMQASSGPGGPQKITSNFSILRMLRILRLIRIMRLVRVLRLIGELRMLVMSIMGSLKSLVWAVALLLMLIYVMGVYITELVLDHRMGISGELNSASQQLERHYGSLGDTILSVYMAVTGGVSWFEILEPLKTEVSVFLVPVFMLYVAFALLCMLNVITGVFVESALLTAKKDKDNYMVNNVRAIFEAHDADGSGCLDWDEFQMAVESEEMKTVLGGLDIAVSEADGLFYLLDAEESGQISAEDFASGCARLRGGAKALDLAILMREVTRQGAELEQHVKNIDLRLNSVGQSLLSGGYALHAPEGAQLDDATIWAGLACIVEMLQLN
eukprot:CAMPEP_0115639990 /NCGR_PEP_ID=MMETSP0272-20121206/35553_1 /TAXON_ID=71861 /ORGANISM="Scrippsiella trochoidea, Strain CCMP3099" /LENGTH=634 /DNA_ID=CAMNT_0003077211 /DNA_START=9 /DNA_END=1911 /DNA_ORIENTATION=-